MQACPKWDFEQFDEKPPNLRNYRQLKTLMDIVQRFYWFTDKPKMFVCKLM